MCFQYQCHEMLSNVDNAKAIREKISVSDEFIEMTIFIKKDSFKVV